MFSVRQKRQIADAVQKILRETGHPELPKGEIQFQLNVRGAEPWSWASIRNNGAVTNPEVNPWNEQQDKPAAEVCEYQRIVIDSPMATATVLYRCCHHTPGQRLFSVGELPNKCVCGKTVRVKPLAEEKK